ncbi:MULTISPECIES: DUF1294 domain-containing protein [unclassified Granulicatella]|uniref:DUF1294 domain-containing protein n=1 Tax=unclassified Granulicatella TaxID=2630493 RepID=UPI001073DB15|nr:MULTISPECIES: DUF1294 domain-containing protein [unclassified Granulicatella]MBF0781138.1 DUF1294 domain-containing protein [Granulicatella sp. 19428wC4_WM01]TFU91793.1 DUF1294 domain-containing protein [Granulicatella sp. WM01]
MLILMLIWNSIVFLLMSIDKYRAKRRLYRISEKVLLLSMMCFGGVGGFLGMFIIHHKTKKWYFYGAACIGTLILYLGVTKLQ